MKQLEGELKKVQHKLVEKSSEVRRRLMDIDKRMGSEYKRIPIAANKEEQSSIFKDMAREIIKCKRLRHSRFSRTNSIRAHQNEVFSQLDYTLTQ